MKQKITLPTRTILPRWTYSLVIELGRELLTQPNLARVGAMITSAFDLLSHAPDRALVLVHIEFGFEVCY